MCNPPRPCTKVKSASDTARRTDASETREIPAQAPPQRLKQPHRYFQHHAADPPQSMRQIPEHHRFAVGSAAPPFLLYPAP
mmetsp:Transcript_2058/g.3292  ORF Transcript_2058/g.3292 Transcript_2058/m.3292 type:complete len:81 (-) Transcript_2058:549-791(-)